VHDFIISAVGPPDGLECTRPLFLRSARGLVRPPGAIRGPFTGRSQEPSRNVQAAARPLGLSTRALRASRTGVMGSPRCMSSASSSPHPSRQSGADSCGSRSERAGELSGPERHVGAPRASGVPPLTTSRGSIAAFADQLSRLRALRKECLRLDHPAVAKRFRPVLSVISTTLACCAPPVAHRHPDRVPFLSLEEAQPHHRSLGRVREVANRALENPPPPPHTPSRGPAAVSSRTKYEGA